MSRRPAPAAQTQSGEGAVTSNSVGAQFFAVDGNYQGAPPMLHAVRPSAPRGAARRPLRELWYSSVGKQLLHAAVAWSAPSQSSAAPLPAAAARTDARWRGERVGDRRGRSRGERGACTDGSAGGGGVPRCEGATRAGGRSEGRGAHLTTLQRVPYGAGGAGPREVLAMLQAQPKADSRLQRIILLGTPESQARLLYHYLKKFGLLDTVEVSARARAWSPPARPRRCRVHPRGSVRAAFTGKAPHQQNRLPVPSPPPPPRGRVREGGRRRT